MSVPSNLIPVRVLRLPEAPVASPDFQLVGSYQGTTYRVRAGDLLDVSGVPTTRQVLAGTGMTGGGTLATDVTLSIAVGGVDTTLMAPTGVAPGTYGSSAQTPVVTVDAAGRIESIVLVGIAGTAGGTVTNVALSLSDGIAGSVTDPAFMATINLSLTDITPDSVTTGSISGTDITASGTVAGVTGTFSGDVGAANLTASSTVSGVTGTFSGDVGAANLTASSTVSGVTGSFSGTISADIATIATSGTIAGSPILTEATGDAQYQPLDADLTSWAAVTRAAGFDTFVATPSSANLAALVTDETGTGTLVFNTGPTLAGASMSNGLNFGSAFAGSADTLTRHIDLYGGIVGFSVTAGRLNYVIPAATSHVFRVGGSDLASVTATGLQGAIGQTTPLAGSFTTLSTSGAATLASGTVGGSPIVSESTGDARYVNVTGDTMTGPLTMTVPSLTVATFGDGLGARQILINGGVGTQSRLAFASAGSARWFLEKNGDAESGSDAGGNLDLKARSDAGSDLGSVISFTRAAGGPITTTRVALGPAGSASAPTWSFSGDTNSGMYLSAADAIGFAAAGAESFTATVDGIQMSHNGIGTGYRATSGGDGASPSFYSQGRRNDGNTSVTFSGILYLSHWRSDAAISSGKSLGGILFGGNHTDGTQANVAFPASITAKASGTFSGINTMPTDLVFHTGQVGRTEGQANVDFGTERLRITSDGRLYGTALHNNSGSLTGTTNQYIASGTYTPTLTNTTNISSSTAYILRYTRVGNVVTLSGQFIVDPTAGSAQTVIGISLPIASNFTSTDQASGTGASYNGASPEIWVVTADSVNDRLTLTGYATNAANHTVVFTAVYTVL